MADDKKRYYDADERGESFAPAQDDYQDYQNDDQADYEADYDQPESDAEADQSADAQDDQQSTMEKLLNFLTGTLNEGKTVPLQNGKRLVNVQMCLDIVDNIRDCLPDEIRWAQGVLDQRRRMLADAKGMADSRVKAADARANAALDNANREAQRITHEAEDRAAEIIEQAQKRARAMIDQSEIMRLAHEEADQICEDARADANDQRLNATRYAETLLGELERDVQATLDAVRRSIDNIAGGGNNR